MSDDANILVSGVKPTGRPHIGNYFGAIKQFVTLQNEYKSLIFIADLHALTTPQSPSELNENIVGVALDYLAVGLDPKKVVIYKQSDVPEVTELAWIFNCITTVPYLSRAHAFKDAESKGREVSVGTFDYPILMAADILIQDADVVPVGSDQKQHLEITADTAEKFNRLFGETLKVPKAHILEQFQTVLGTDGKKMSKSYKNTIELFATDEEIREAVMQIPTDSRGVDEPKDPERDNVFALHKLFTEGPEFEDLHERYEAGKIGYKESKEMLIGNIIKLVSPLRERRQRLAQNRNEILEILENGGKIAKKRAEEKMRVIREKIGVSLK